MRLVDLTKSDSSLRIQYVSFQKALQFLSGKRRNAPHRRAGVVCFSLRDESSLFIRHKYSPTPFAVLHRDNTFEFLRVPCMRSESLLVWRMTNRNCFSHIRRNVVNQFYIWVGGEVRLVPVGPGTKIKDGKVLNPDHVTVQRRLPTKEGAAAWRKLYKTVAPAVAAVLRFEPFEQHQNRHSLRSTLSVNDALSTLEAGEPDAAAIAAIGVYAAKHNHWVVARNPNYWTEFRKRAHGNARKRLRDAFMERHEHYEVL